MHPVHSVMTRQERGPKTRQLFSVSVSEPGAGGPAMIRAAAKNHSHVAVVVDPNDYDELLQHLLGSSSEQESMQYRKRLAWKAFQHCATYDSTVAEWLWSQIGGPIHVKLLCLQAQVSKPLPGISFLNYHTIHHIYIACTHPSVPVHVDAAACFLLRRYLSSSSTLHGGHSVSRPVPCQVASPLCTAMLSLLRYV